MKPRFVLAALLTAAALPLVFAADKSEIANETAKEELAKLAEFVGPWTVNGDGTVDGKKSLWKEKWSWAWKFDKGGVPSLAAKVEDSKYFTEATVAYDPASKGYKAVLKDDKGETQEYTGEIDRRGIFVLSRTDEKTKDVHKLKLSTAASGIRLNVLYEVQTGGKGLAGTVYKASGNKEGQSIAGGVRKPECVVTGGSASIKVSYKGKDYYVCCSGCADEFRANPEKYVNK